MIEYIFVALVLLFLVTIYFWFDKDSYSMESRLVKLINAKQVEIARLREQNKELQHEIERLRVVISAGIDEVQKVCDNRQHRHHGPVEGLEDWAVHAADYLPEEDDDV